MKKEDLRGMLVIIQTNFVKVADDSEWCLGNHNGYEKGTWPKSWNRKQVGKEREHYPGLPKSEKTIWQFIDGVHTVTDAVPILSGRMDGEQAY